MSYAASYQQACFARERHAPGEVFWRLLPGIAALFIFIASVTCARAQQNGILGRGDVVVTGFSGIKPADVPVPPGGSPLDTFFIDLDGVSAQIQSLATLGAPPQGQLIATPSRLQIKARQVGQVFAIALDDGQGAPVPNIYLGATAAYGLNIVLPDANGDGAPERSKKGKPGAQWMAGQFGPDAGPGAIWRVDGMTGAVTLFATLPDNAGPGVGDVVFDGASRQFLASDLDNGLIYRIDANGQIIDSFDHGATGRPAKGLPPVNDDGVRLDMTSPAFDSENPATWGFTPEERRVHGMAMHSGRLFYAVEGQVWSVSVSQAGFGGDARWEFDAKGLPGGGPVTDMLFDAQGRIYLAQRGAQRNSYDYSVFAEAEKANVVRYRREEPDSPATESAWIEDPEAYAIGMPADHNHAEGGIALGYAHDANGMLRYGACGGMLWSTGHRLRPGTDDAGIAEADVHGLQGNDVSLVRPQNVPPQQSYFTDYDNLFGDAAKSGHVGDVEIWQPCDGFTPSYGQLPPGLIPPGDIPPELPPEFPGDDYHTNLKLTKKAMPRLCSRWGGGWLCQYRVRVTNTGPDNYFGPILVRDWLPANPPGAIMAFSPTPPWTCWATGPSAHNCFRPGVFLAPTWSVDLFAYVWVPESYRPCHVVNAAAIEWAPPGSQWNTNPFDDVDFAVAHIPAEHCRPGDRTDLTIYKVPYGRCFPFQGNIRCLYVIGVQNLGPGTYNGPIVVEDTVPAGTTATFAGAPWAPCVGVGNIFTCTHPGANLAPSAFAPPIFVAIDTPLPLARRMECRVSNHVRITQAPGGSPQNFDPTNDTADAVAAVPEEVCYDRPRRSNLRIEKTANDACLLQSGDWCRSFTITVTNTGPNTFNGPIQVTDIAPPGLTVNAGGAGWTCVGATCTTNGAVLLAKNPPSGDSVSFGVTVEGTAAQARQMQCRLTNRARIDSPLGAPKNVLPGDDMDQISVGLPPRFCQPSTIPSNLRIEKIAQTDCDVVDNGWQCDYTVTVTNMGPGPYQGLLEVEDELQAVPGASMTPVTPPAFNWTCTQAGQTANCKILAADLDANENVYFHVRAFVPAHSSTCSLTNTARILQAQGGSLQNGNAGDDEDSATAQFAPGHDRCGPVLQTCPPGYSWNGERCVRPDPGCRRGWTPTPVKGVCCPPGQPWNQRLGKCGGDIPPPPPPPLCERGWTPTPIPGKCCPPGEPWNPQLRECGRDVPPPPPPCERGWTPTPVKGVCCPPGQPWNLRLQKCGGDVPPPPPPVCEKGWTPTPIPGKCCPPGQPWNPKLRECRQDAPQCNKTARCIGGKVWSMESCSCVCPPGAVMKHGQCTTGQPECPPNMVGTPPNCRKQECPPNTVGVFPDCKKIEIDRPCPPGTVGRFPNCKKIEIDRPCPPGTVGKFPNCKKIEIDRPCPRGTVGKFPNCKKIEIDRPCPAGTIGRFPNCRPILRVCPPGMVGRPPLCRKIEGRPQGTFRPGSISPQLDRGPRITPQPGGPGPLR